MEYNKGVEEISTPICPCGSNTQLITDTRAVRGFMSFGLCGVACTNPRCKKRTPIAFITEQSAITFWNEHFSEKK